MKQKINVGVRILLGLILTVFGLNKFFSFMPMPEFSEPAGALMGAFMEAGYLMPMIAIVEVVTGVLGGILCTAHPRIAGAFEREHHSLPSLSPSRRNCGGPGRVRVERVPAFRFRRSIQTDAPGPVIRRGRASSDFWRAGYGVNASWGALREENLRT